MDERETALVARVREVAREEFAPRAAGIDREGSFPRENVDTLKSLGLAGLSLSADQGGLGLSGEAQMRTMEELAYGDASTAVALNMHRIGLDILASLPPFPRRNEVLADVARNGALLCAPGSIPSGELDNRRSGYQGEEQGDSIIVNGRSGFASMSEGATYVLMPGLIDRGTDDAGNKRDPDLLLALPRIDAPGLRLLYNWDAMGLRGTASHDIVVENLAIPKTEALMIPLPMFKLVFETVQAQGGPGVQRRSLGTLGILAIWLGLAQSAYDFTVEYVAKRHGYLAGTSTALGTPPGYRSEQPWAQIAVGNMEHWLETSRTIFYATVSKLDSTFPNPQSFVRLLVRTVYHLRRMTEEVAMGAMKVCGAHAYVKDRPLERIFRDMMGGVVMAWKTDELAQMLGRGALGFPIMLVGPAGS